MRAPRRFQRGLKRKPLALIKKLRKAKREAGAGEKPEPVRTHLRNMIIVPEMIGSIIGVYNGKTFNQVRLLRQVVHAWYFWRLFVMRPTLPDACGALTHAGGDRARARACPVRAQVGMQPRAGARNVEPTLLLQLCVPLELPWVLMTRRHSMPCATGGDQARHGGALPGRVLHQLQARQARQARHRCHALLALHPPQVSACARYGNGCGGRQDAWLETSRARGPHQQSLRQLASACCILLLSPTNWDVHLH